MFLFRLKRTTKTCLALLAFFLTGVCTAFLHRFTLPKETNACGREYYFSHSSQTEIEKDVSPFSVWKVQGESARYFFKGEREAEKFVQATLLSYRAKIRFEEETDGEKISYCYSPSLFSSMKIKGEEINLQIVQKGSSVRIGTPLIFGGF